MSDWNRSIALAAVLGFGAAFLAAGESTRAAEPISAHQYLGYIKRLSSDSMRGRGTGTPELDRAADYIAGEFRKSGLKPVPGLNGYFQSFAVSIDSQLGPENKVSYRIGDRETDLKISTDFLPLSFSGKASITAGVVFAGYGITAPECDYDDYAGIDVRGKFVLVLSHEPQEYESSSVFEGRVYSEHSQLFSKALNARVHGAAGVIYVSDTVNHSSAEKLEPFTSNVSPDNPGLAFVQIHSASAEAWFGAAQRDFKETQSAIDKDLKPRSFAFPDTLSVSMQIDVRHRSRPVHNVVGFLPGRTDEYIVVGAHYDHLGLGEQYSLSPEKVGTAHPGADDNASGTAGVIAMARWFGRQPKAERGILFIAFAGEEIGLLGSSFYVNHPMLPLKNAVLMINMDMIGRIRDGKVLVSGAGQGSPHRARLSALGSRFSLDLDLDDSGVYGSSDHTSFRAKSVPVLFFFSGLHADYHRTTDTWEKIEAQGAAKLLTLLSHFVSDLTHRVDGVRFADSATPETASPAIAGTN